MRSYVTLFALSFLAALVLTPLVRARAIGWGAVDLPDEDRRIHAHPTPRLGGVAIYLAFMLTLACVPFLGNLVGASFRSNLPKMATLLAPAALVFLFGVYDDFRGASAPLKLCFQVVAATAVYLSGHGIAHLSSPFGGSWHLPALVSFGLTTLWIVGITNAFNLIDGIDGLAAGASVFALLSILIFSIAQGNPEVSLLAVILIGAVLGFLRYNFNPATIFLGDSGSLFLGFMAAVLSLVGSQKGSTIVAIAIPLVAFGLPVVEASLSIVRRFLRGQPIFAGDRGHIHHRLLARGFNQRQAVIVLYGVSALFALFALMLLNPQRSIAALIFFVLGVGVLFGVQHLRYAEFSELGSQLRQLNARRRAFAANVRLRQMSDDVSAAASFSQLFAALDGLSETLEFDAIQLDAGPTHWSWRRDEQVNLDHCWMLRVPLTNEAGRIFGELRFCSSLKDEVGPLDIGHLSGSLRRELSAALLRLTEEKEKSKIKNQKAKIKNSEPHPTV